MYKKNMILSQCLNDSNNLSSLFNENKKILCIIGWIYKNNLLWSIKKILPSVWNRSSQPSWKAKYKQLNAKKSTD